MQIFDETLLSEAVYSYADMVEEKYREYMKNCSSDKHDELNKKISLIKEIGYKGQFCIDKDELDSMYSKLIEMSIDLDFADCHSAAADNTAF